MDCCKPTHKTQTGCPHCGANGKAVSGITISSMLAPELASSFPDGAWICKALICPVLYYGDQGQTAVKDQARVRVGYKETQDPVPLCYCFDVTQADIQQEIAQTGRCTVPERISDEIRAGRCDCERRNPAGVCCLGEMRATVNAALTKEQTKEKYT
jgi:hypothetical protein